MHLPSTPFSWVYLQLFSAVWSSAIKPVFSLSGPMGHSKVSIAIVDLVGLLWQAVASERGGAANTPTHSS